MYEQIEKYYKNETNATFTDSLTGLFNHGFFQTVLDEEVKRFQRYGTPFTLTLIDIDSFTSYNSRFSPVKGDRVLKEIARMIKENIRQVDLAARYSGDVFALILTKSESHQALVVVERIRQAVEMLFNGDTTVSIGLACYPKDASRKGSLIMKAQEALQQAKNKGKSRVDFFEKENESITDKKSRILLVDDDPQNLKLLEALLLPLDYDVIKASNGEEALSIVNKVDIDLVLLDIMMPRMDGYEVCRRLKGSESTRMIPVVMITALDDIEAKIKGIEIGADDFITKPPNKMELFARVKTLTKVKALNNNLTSLESVLFSLAGTIEAKDRYTQGHIWRVSELAVALAKKMCLSERSIKEIKLGGILHDIGKIGVPGNILNKAGHLNREELAVMKDHPHIGYKICLPLKKALGTALDIVQYHHEKLDGSGYPDGLKSEDIPIGAKDNGRGGYL